MSPNIKKLVFFSIIVLSLAFAVVGFLFLPETVVTQIGSNGNTTMPKLFAILLPLAVALGFDYLFLLGKNEKRDLLVSAVGVVIMIVTLAVNL